MFVHKQLIISPPPPSLLHMISVTGTCGHAYVHMYIHEGGPYFMGLVGPDIMGTPKFYDNRNFQNLFY